MAAFTAALSGIALPASTRAQTEPNVFTFQQLRLAPIPLTGPLGTAVVQFGLPAHWSRTANAQLRLSFNTLSPGFQEIKAAEAVSETTTAGAKATPTRQAGILRVSLNDSLLANVPLNATGVRAVAIDIPAQLFTATQTGALQTLSFQLEDLEQCGKNDQTRIVIQPTSALVVPHQVAPLQREQRDLRLLPFPLLQRSFTPDEAVIVVPDKPSAQELQAALNVAAGLGRMTQGKLALRLVTVNALDEATRNQSHLILIGKPANMPLLKTVKLGLALSGSGFDAAAPDNGVLQMAESPWNPQKVVLVVSGATDAGAALAGKALGSGDVRASRFNDLALITAESALTNTTPNPNLLASADTPLADLGYTEAQLRGAGRQFASYTFSLPEGRALPAGAYFQASFVHSALIDDKRSSLTVMLNGSNIGSLPLDENSTRLSQAQIVLPKDGLRPGENFIRVQADLQHRDSCVMKANEMNDLWVSLRADSLLHVPVMKEAIEATLRKLNLAGHLSALLSQPNLSNQLFVVGPEDVRGWNLAAQVAYGLGAQQLGPRADGSDVGAAFSDALPGAVANTRDVIVVGKATTLNGIIESLNAVLPATFAANTNVAAERDSTLQYRAPEGADIGYVQLATSPWNNARSLMAVMGSTDAGVANAANALLQPDQRAKISGNLVFINGEQIVAKDNQAVMASAQAGQIGNPANAITASDGLRLPAQAAVVPGQAGTAPSWLVPVLAVSIGVLLLILAVAAITSVSRRRQPPAGGQPNDVE